MSQGRQNGRIGLNHFRGDRRQVSCKGESLLNAVYSCLAGVAVRLRRKLHEPLVKLINRGARVCLPQMWLIGVDGHGFL